MNALELLKKLGAPGWLVGLVARLVPDAALPLVAESGNPEVNGILLANSTGVVIGRWVSVDCNDMMDGGKFKRTVFAPGPTRETQASEARVVMICAL